VSAEGISLSLSCPSCGGSLTSLEGQRTIACPYCRSLLSITGDKGVYTVMYRNTLDDSRVKAELAKWFDKGLKARDLPRQATVTEVYPIYIPFWRLRARAAGWVCGYREERRTDKDGHTHTERVYMEKMVFRDFEWSQIACDPGDIGINRLPGLYGQAVSHEAGDIPTFEATTSPDDARAAAIDGIRRDAIASTNVPNITFQRVHVLPHFLVLTFYPIWMCRYTYRGRTYFATLDGVDGKSLSGRAPGDPLYQSIALVLGCAIGGTTVGLSVWALPRTVEGGVLGAIVGTLIFIMGFMFFRHGSEVTEGDLDKPYKASFRKFLPGGRWA
jgi:hypothetical protein